MVAAIERVSSALLLLSVAALAIGCAPPADAPTERRTAAADNVPADNAVAAEEIANDVVGDKAIGGETRADDPSAACDAGDWPWFLGPTHDAVSPEADLRLAWGEYGPPQLWQIPCGEGYSSPVVRGQRLILFHRRGDQEIIECRDAETGAPRWKFPYPTAYRCSVDYSNGPYSTPIIGADRVYAIGAEGKVHCVALENGAPLWQRDLHADYGVQLDGFYPVAASPLLQAGRLIFNLGGADRDAGIVGLDPATGATVWKATAHHYTYATPSPATIHGCAVTLVCTREALVALAPRDGRVLWEVPFQTRTADQMPATPPLALGDLVLASSYTAGSVCVRVAADGRVDELWRDDKRLDSQYNNLLAFDGAVCGLSSLKNSLRCLDPRSGQILWDLRWRSGRGTWSIRVGSEGLLWSEKGHLGVMPLSRAQAAAATMTKKPLLHGPCFPAPALSRGRLYLRNADTLLCLNLRVE